MSRSGVLFAVACMAACRFEHGALSSSSGDGGSDPDARRGDAPMTDAMASDAQVDAITNMCPTSYSLLFGTHRYRTSIVGTQTNVAADCAGDGQHIIKIESAQENEFARSTLAPAAAGGSYFWIGLTWSGSAWVWDDGSALGTYENFSGGVPNGTSSPCVDVSYTSGTWSAYQCTSPPHDSLCECDGT